MPQSKSTELCSEAAVVPHSKSTELCSSVAVIPPRLLMNILRLQQLMGPSYTFPWMNFLATPVLSILRRRHPVSMARVSEILSNLNVRKPAGPDEILPKLLKIAAPVIAGPMIKLFSGAPSRAKRAWDRAPYS